MLSMVSLEKTTLVMTFDVPRFDLIIQVRTRAIFGYSV